MIEYTAVVPSSDLTSDPTRGPALPRLTINMLAEHDGTIEVRSCEVIGSGCRNRTSFQKKIGIDEVFVPTIAAGLNQCLRGLKLKPEVVSLPDLKIEAPGLALGNAHILVSNCVEGQVSIIIRFRAFLGSLDAVLCDSLRPFPNLPAILDKTASEVLFDITLPILNICSAEELGDLSESEVLGYFLTNLKRNTHELTFRATLLKRFLEDISSAPLGHTPAFKTATSNLSVGRQANDPPAQFAVKYG